MVPPRLVGGAPYPKEANGARNPLTRVILPTAWICWTGGITWTTLRPLSGFLRKRNPLPRSRFSTGKEASYGSCPPRNSVGSIRSRATTAMLARRDGASGIGPSHRARS